MNDRARVPFALIGVLLLASSATLAPALTETARRGHPDVDVAMERLTSESRGAIEEGIEHGARMAAREPVLARANTSVGHVLDPDATFRDALKLRLYVAVRDHLRRLNTTHRGLDLEASLPATPNPDALERAMDRVTIGRAGPNGTALRATVGNVTLTARRGEHVVARKRIDPTVVVPVPVLPVHDRVRTYQQRLDGGPLEPGMGRRLTAGLYAVTWARGYAQYGKVPIQNVLANRHLALLANGGVLRTQQRVFGRSDPLGRKVHALTTIETALVDVLATGSPETLSFLKDARRVVQLGEPSPGGARRRLTDGGRATEPSDTMTVGVNGTADRAFVDLLGEFNETIDETFTADVRLRVEDVTRYGSEPPWPDPPRGDCSRVSSTDRDRVTVTNRTTVGQEPASAWHLLEAYARRVAITRTRERSWRCDGVVRRRNETATETVVVTLQLEGFHLNGPAPRVPIETTHEAAGPFDGPNLADVRRKATAELLHPGERIGDLAKAVADGENVSRSGRVQGRWPSPLADWLYRDVARLREGVRDITVTTTAGEVATFQARPARELLGTLRNRSSRLVGVPGRYDHVAHRARVAVRYRYVQLVLDRLRDRARKRNDSRAELSSELQDRENGSLGTLQRSYARRNDWQALSSAAVEMRVHASPSYLTTRKTTRAVLPALAPGETFHPMVVRNFNVFSLPYGDLAGLVTRIISGPKNVRLRTGAQLLRSAKRLRTRNTTTDGRPRVGGLRAATSEALDRVGVMYGFRMDDRLGHTAGAWRGVLQTALDDYPTVRSRASAVANRSIVPRLVRAAANRWPDRYDSSTDRDRLAVVNRVVLQRILEVENSGPVQAATNRSMEAVRGALERELSRRFGDALENATIAVLRNRTQTSWSRVPSGLPVAPVPGYWFATVNAWHAQVRGEYARFAVTVPRGTPANPGASFAYIRDGTTVAVDVDEDGQSERLGTASRLAFEVDTWIGIAVPPYSPGVGDIDGGQNETSSGWPWPSEPPPARK